MTGQGPARIVVTGAGGFVGSHLCEALLAAGHTVTGIEAFIDSYPPEIKRANLAACFGHARFRLVRADLSRDELEPHLHGADAVVHEAAMPGLPRSWTDIDAYSRHNVVALLRLLDAARNVGIRRFVHASTSSVYGREALGDESSPTRPVSPYGATKLAAEHLLHAYRENFDLPVVILRYFSIYGPRQRPDMAYSIFIDRLLAGRPITIFGDGHQSRSNTYVTDCVTATLLALRSGRPGETYNIGGGESIELIEAVDVIAQALDLPAVIEFAPARPGDQRHTMADITKARRELGYEPTVRPREGLARQVAWRLAREVPAVSA